jgi:hypothetical protein
MDTRITEYVGSYRPYVEAFSARNYYYYKRSMTVKADGNEHFSVEQ